MSKIINFLDTASRHYYNGIPIISDEQFDALAQSVDYHGVGTKQHNNVYTHYKRMYSLQKWYTDDKVISPLSTERDITMSPKLDGAAISILYIKGELVLALTRGDGTEGRDITEKILAAKSVPSNLPSGFPEVLQVTGEMCSPKTIENARNYAAGALNLGSVDEFRTRSVEFFAYGVYPYLTEYFDIDMSALKTAGFNTVQDPELDKIFPTDGLVFRVNSNKRFEELGYTNKHPRGAYARKERSECVETILLAVNWQVGKSGKVTPVAILEPILIGDAIISRATLNNGAFIQALDLRIGDVVAVRRAGEIIPQIVHKVV